MAGDFSTRIHHHRDAKPFLLSYCLLMLARWPMLACALISTAPVALAGQGWRSFAWTFDWFTVRTRRTLLMPTGPKLNRPRPAALWDDGRAVRKAERARGPGWEQDRRRSPVDDARVRAGQGPERAEHRRRHGPAVLDGQTCSWCARPAFFYARPLAGLNMAPFTPSRRETASHRSRQRHELWRV